MVARSLPSEVISEACGKRLKTVMFVFEAILILALSNKVVVDFVSNEVTSCDFAKAWPADKQHAYIPI